MSEVRSEPLTDISTFTSSEQGEYRPVVQSTTLANLPFAVFARILSYLDLNDKFSLINFESIRPKLEYSLRLQHSDLVVSNINPSSGNHWWISNDLISFQRDIISGFNFLNYYTMFGCLKRIRFQFDLHVSDLIYMQAFFSGQLEQLEIGTLIFSSQPMKVLLYNLRVLFIKQIKNGGNKLLTIESPYLSHVYFGDTAINCIHFVYSISIVYFEFDLDRSITTLGQNQDILRLTNARVIKCNRALDLTKESVRDLILIPPQLSQLHLNTQRLTDLNTAHTCSLNFEQMFYFLISHHNLRQTKRADGYCELQIFLNGVQMKEGRGFQDYDFFGPLVNVHFRNRELLSIDGFPDAEQLEYQLLSDLTAREDFNFQFTFTRRYPNVCAVTLHFPEDTVNPYVFYHFLAACRRILELEILYAFTFDQELYDEISLLASLRNSLLKFKLIDKVHVKNNKLKSLDFIANFDFLRRFYCNQLNRARVIKLLLLLEMRASRCPATFIFEFDFTGRLEMTIVKKRGKEYDLQLVDYVEKTPFTVVNLSLSQLLETFSQKAFQDVLPHFLDFEDTLRTVI